MSPNFSVIIPAHHPHVAFEGVAAPDGPPRGEVDVAASFRQDLQLRFIEQPRSGPAAARNHGMRHAFGRFLAFTGDDCGPAPGRGARRGAI